MHRIVKVVITPLAALIIVACGQSPIHISPAVADAKNFAGGVVPFTANGVSSPTWCIGTTRGICNGNIPPLSTPVATRSVFRAKAERSPSLLGEARALKFPIPVSNCLLLGRLSLPALDGYCLTAQSHNFVVNAFKRSLELELNSTTQNRCPPKPCAKIEPGYAVDAS